MSNIAEKDHIRAANRFREMLSTYQNSEDLINIGAYKKGLPEKLMRPYNSTLS